ncbi:sugar kinase [bacterium AH-315-A03]|nr:sugar kinase [bacterium AH-315-A03]
MSVDVVTLGEALLRLSVVSGSRFSEMSELRVSVGGAESNVAVALAQMGCSVAWLSAVPDNHFGRYVLKDLARHGVDTQFVVTEPNARIGLYFVEPGSTPRPDRVIYDRKNSAVTRLQSSDVPWGEVESAKAAHITGITPALSESLRMLAIEFTKRARSAGVPVCVDVNYRAHLWGIEEARPVLLELCREATLVILTEEDARGVFGFAGSVQDLSRRARDAFSAKYVAVTRGSKGALLFDGQTIVEQSGMDAAVVDRIGSGDAFAAGLVLGVVNGDVVNNLPTAVAMAVVKLGIQGDHFLADLTDVVGIMSGNQREVDR